MLFLFLSPTTAEQQNNKIYCVATCKMLLPTARACGTFCAIKFLLDVEILHDIQHFIAGVSDNIRGIFTQVKWGLDNCLSESAYCIAVKSLSMYACVKVLPSFRQIHQFVINGNSCSRTDCKNGKLQGPAENSDKTNLPLRNIFLETTAWSLTVTIST